LLTGATLSDRPLLTLGVLMISLGVQLIGIGLIGELVIRVRQGTHPRPIYAVREELDATKP
jgi:hypothetical protein